MKETSKLSSKKQNTPSPTSGRSNVQAGGRSFIAPTFVPRDSSSGKSFASCRRELITPAKPSSGSIKATHVRKSSKSKFDIDDADPNFLDRLVLEVGARDSSCGKSFSNSRRESIAPVKPCKGTDIRKSSRSKFDIDDADPNFLDRVVLEVGARDFDEDKNPTPECFEEKFEENPSPPIVSNPQSGKIPPLSIVTRWKLNAFVLL